MKTQELEKPLEWSELNLPPVETIAQEAKRQLLVIPENKWCTGIRTDNNDNHCALGHYCLINHGHDGDGINAPKANELIQASNLFNRFNGCTIAAANNGWMPDYQQETPKQRTIALLDDMIKAGF